MSEYERFIKIHIGTPHEYVIKDIINNETYGMFKGDDKAVIQLLKTINELNEEKDELKKELKALRKKYNNFSDTVDKRLKELRE